AAAAVAGRGHGGVPAGGSGASATAVALSATGHLAQQRFEAIQVVLPGEVLGAGAGGAREGVVFGAEGTHQRARERVQVLGAVDEQGGERAVEELGGAGAAGGGDGDAGGAGVRAGVGGGVWGGGRAGRGG